MNSKRYLKIFDIESGTADIKFLTKLIEKQKEFFPYENVSKLLQYKKGIHRLPTYEEYLAGQEEFGFGGTCYAQAYYFCQLLQELGFNAKNVKATTDGVSGLHLNIRVVIDEISYIVDFGFMDAFCGPFKEFGEKVTETHTGRDFIFIPASSGGKFRFEIRSKDRLHRSFDEENEIKSISEMEEVIRESFRPGAYFIKNVLIGRRYGRPCYNLWNDELIYTIGETVHKNKLQSKEDLRKVIGQKMKLAKFPMDFLIEEFRKKVSTAF